MGRGGVGVWGCGVVRGAGGEATRTIRHMGLVGVRVSWVRECIHTRACGGGATV